MIEKSIADLNSTWQGLSEKLYNQSKESDFSDTSENEDVKGSSGKKKKTDEVEEADFEEVK